MKTIGILGGMGPVATEELYRKILLYSQQQYKAVQDSDYPTIVLYSIPFTGTDETGIFNEEKAFEEFVNGIEKLKAAGSNFIVIPCNTLHHFIERLESKTNTPILNMVEETSNEVKRNKIKTVGLLASESSYNLKLYEKFLGGVKYVIPDATDRKILTKIVLRVMGGKHSNKDATEIQIIVGKMKARGAEAVIFGCTEFSVLPKEKIPLKVIDALEVLAEKAVEESRR